MRSTSALLWEIWRRHRSVVAVIVGLTIAGRLLDLSARDTSPLIDVLAMVSFLLLFGIFNQRFPHRLFILPVSSLRLVVVPVLTAIVSVELLYLPWMGLLSRDASTSRTFVAVLLGALIVFYQAILWTLESLGPLRLVVAAAVAVIMFGIALLPSFPPNPPPAWRSEGSLAALVVGVAIVAFLVTWVHVVRARCGGARAPLRPGQSIGSVAALPARRRAFASPQDAHFWFEWRSSGVVLPILVGGVLVIVIGPLSWLARAQAADTLRLLLATLATPMILAIPVGMAFGKPTFWSEELSVPAFVAVRPLTDEDIIAIKVKVAIASVVGSWLLVLSFAGLWLPLWANLDSLSRLAIQVWAFHGHSVAAVYGVAALVVIGGMSLTWRFLVSGLWSGASGSRALFIGSAMSVVLVVIIGVAFDAHRLPRWLLENPARVAALVWIVSIAVVVKYWLAAWSWRRVSARYARQYLLLWGAGTTSVLVLALVFWGVARIYVALDIYRFQSLMILISLLAVPLVRVALAPSCLGRNRHRRR